MTLAQRKARLIRMGWSFPEPTPGEIIQQAISGHVVVSEVRPARHVAEKHGPLGFMERVATSEERLIAQLEEIERDHAQRGHAKRRGGSQPVVVDGPADSASVGSGGLA